VAGSFGPLFWLKSALELKKRMRPLQQLSKKIGPFILEGKTSFVDFLWKRVR